MTLEEALLNLRSCYSRADILEHWNALREAYIEEAPNADLSFTDWAIESGKIEKPILVLVGEKVFAGFHNQLPSRTKTSAQNLADRLRLGSVYELCLGLGTSIVKSRDSLQLLLRVMKKRPQTSFLELLRELRNARDTFRKPKQGSSKNMAKFAPEDIKNFEKVFLAHTHADSTATKHDLDVHPAPLMMKGASMAQDNSDGMNLLKPGAAEVDNHVEHPATTTATTIQSISNDADAKLEGINRFDDNISDQELVWQEFSTKLIDSGGNPAKVAQFHDLSTDSSLIPPESKISRTLEDPNANTVGENMADQDKHLRDPEELDNYEADFDDFSGDEGSTTDASLPSSDVEQPRRVHVPNGPGYDFDDVLSDKYNLPNSVTLRKTPFDLPTLQSNSQSTKPSMTEALQWGDDTILLPNGTNIHTKDFVRLTGKGWLNDELINGLLHLHLLGCPNVLLMSSFFYANLAGSGHGIDYASVQKWTTKKDIFNQQYLVVPINQNNNHWKLAIVANVSSDTAGSTCPLEFRVVTIDSMDAQGDQDNLLIYRKMAAYIMAEGKSKKRLVSEEHITWKHASMLPQQNNGWDCGVYLLGYLSRFARDPGGFLCDIQQDTVGTWHIDAPGIRRQMKSELLAVKAKTLPGLPTIPTPPPSDANKEPIIPFDIPPASPLKTTHTASTPPPLESDNTFDIPPAPPATTTHTASAPPPSEAYNKSIGPADALRVPSSSLVKPQANPTLPPSRPYNQQSLTSSVLQSSPTALGPMSTVAQSLISNTPATPPQHKMSTTSLLTYPSQSTDGINHQVEDDQNQLRVLAEVSSYSSSCAKVILHQASAIQAIMKMQGTRSEVQQLVIQDIENLVPFVVSESQWALLLHADQAVDLSVAIGTGTLHNTGIEKGEDMPHDVSPQRMRKRYDDLSAQKALQLEQRLTENEEELHLVQSLAQLSQSVLCVLETSCNKHRSAAQVISLDLDEQEELLAGGLMEKRLARYRNKWAQDIRAEISKLQAISDDLSHVTTGLSSLYTAALVISRNATRLEEIYAGRVRGTKVLVQEFIDREVAYEQERQRPKKRLQARLAAWGTVGL